MRGRALAGVLSLVAAVVLVPADGGVQAAEDPCADPAPAPFADREEIAAVHRPAVDCLWHLGIVEGSVDVDGRRSFQPRAAVTRAQFAGMLHRLLEEEVGDGVPEPVRPRFSDVAAGHTFDDEVHALAAAGVIEGVDGDRFDPAGDVRRDQSASLLVRSASYATGRSLGPAAGPYYLDVRSGAHHAAVDAAFEHGLAEGTRRPCGDGEGRFAPARSADRQEIATLLAGLIGALDGIRAGEGGDQRADPACPEPVWQPSVLDAREYAQERAGSVSFAAVGTDGEMVGYRSGTQVAAASVIKVMFMTAYLRQPDVRERDLQQADRDLLEPMIRRSANDPATRIADRLGPGPIERLADDAGMRDFAYTRPWGLSQTSARDQAAFMLQLEQLLPERHRDDALELLTEIVDDQRWGIGQLATPGWTAHFKGGWGSGTGAVNHQVVLLRHEDGSAVAVTVMTTGNPNHDAGSATLEGVFDRLLADLPAY